jgi:glycine cleavage system transcriptional repressor
MNEVVITAVGADRPGIVAALTGALLDLGGNLEEARAALLRGSFATMLAVAVPDSVGAEEVRAALAGPAAELGLGIWVGPAERRPAAAAGRRCVVSVYGADRRGIVHGMAAALAGRGVNVLDLSARLVGDPQVYVLGMEVELPDGLDAEGLRVALAPAAREHGVELTVEDEEDEVL